MNDPLKFLARLPEPPPDENFVRKVMARLRPSEVFSWREFWKVPVLGFGLAAVLFAVLTTYDVATPFTPDVWDDAEMAALTLEDL